MTLEKGAMIFHMLRWEVGDKMFLNILKGALSQYTDQSIRTDDFERVAEAQSQQQLTPFFAQWIDGTGAPAFTDKYAVYRLGNNKGFRTIGEINQDLDLFRMPVELRIETDGKTVNQHIDVVGTDTQYVVDTFGRPRRISIDPGDWVLKSTPDLQVRISILKGQQLVAQGDLLDALAEYKKALDANPQSSLASYRIGEVLYDPVQLPGRRQRLPRCATRRRRAAVDRGLEPHRHRQNLRRHRPARPRRQRVSPRRPDQRQYPGRRQRSPPGSAKALQPTPRRLRPLTP